MLSMTTRLACVLVLALTRADDAMAARIEGSVRDGAGAPLVGAQVTVQSGEPAHRLSVWSDAAGRSSAVLAGRTDRWLGPAARGNWSGK